MPTAFRPHLLVADDEAPIREALATALGVDYVVHTVATGEDACSILRAQPIAAIILDAVLEGEDGGPRRAVPHPLTGQNPGAHGLRNRGSRHPCPTGEGG